MSPKKLAIITVIVFLLIASIPIGCTILSNLYDNPQPPTLPDQSSPGRVTLTSSGCCYWVSDAVVKMVEPDGSSHTLISKDAVYEYDIFECVAIPEVESPIQIIIEFVGHQAEDDYVSLVAAEYSNSGELAKTGLLLEIGDAELFVYSGDEQRRFKSGAFDENSEDGIWFQVD